MFISSELSIGIGIELPKFGQIVSHCAVLAGIQSKRGLPRNTNER